MKKKVLLFVAVFMLVFTSGLALGAEVKVKIFVNEKEVKTESKVENGTTYVPLRAISEMLGAKVDWVQATQSVVISSDPAKIISPPEDKSAGIKIYVDGKKVTTASKVENETTYVPLRAISEMLGAKVDWVQATQSVMITSKDANTASGVSQTHEGVTVEITNVVQDKDSLRFYVKYINKTEYGIITGDEYAKVIVNGELYEFDPEFNHERYNTTDLKQAKRSIGSNVTETSVIFFEPIEGVNTVTFSVGAEYHTYTFENVKVNLK